MTNPPYIINQRFSVQESQHTLTDLATGTVTRLEARLMKLLHLLVQQQGQVVTRQQLIVEIWDNYGGAEDGLNQAISFLRKALDDTDKQLIRTVPKQGYLLEASITTQAGVLPMATTPAAAFAESSLATITPATPPNKRSILYLLLLLVLVLAVLTWWFLQERTPTGPWEPPGATPDTTYLHQEIQQQR